MAKPLLDDELWEVIEPLLPPRPSRVASGTRDASLWIIAEP